MIVRGKPRRALEAEVVTLRHQIAVLQRTTKRPELTDADRGVIAGLARGHCCIEGGQHRSRGLGVLLLSGSTVLPKTSYCISIRDSQPI
jgi:hypothetical protein